MGLIAKSEPPLPEIESVGAMLGRITLGRREGSTKAGDAH